MQTLQGYQKTSKLLKRLDEIENMIVLLDGDVAADDRVDFSLWKVLAQIPHIEKRHLEYNMLYLIMEI